MVDIFVVTGDFLVSHLLMRHIESGVVSGGRTSWWVGRVARSLNS